MWTNYLVSVEWLLLEAPPLASVGILAKAPEEDEIGLIYLEVLAYTSLDEVLEEE